MSDSLKDEQPAARPSAASPSSGHKAEARIAAPDCLRIDVCVVPLTRPRAISNGVSLSDKLGREVATFVSEDGAIDALLLRDRVVNELAPDEHGVGVACPKN